MTPERWHRIKGVLGAAVARRADERAEYLDTACADDPELRREVDSLIAAHEHAGSGFLDAPWARRPPPALGAADGTLAAGTRVGSYLVRERIGRGGMGEVYAAVRADGHYEQTVALKLVRSGLATPEVMERFRAERQILAGFDHPNIARLLDGGATEGGVPYLVMELVDGVPIDAFCRDRKLPVRDRLQLFLRVCAAVQFAHQRLVIHRDLKPSNILITGDGVPKLLDFGIAKILDPLGNTQETALRPFTLEYASPEQVRGEPVSTASDVYALGVVLYQLLTGCLPYMRETGTSGELADAITGREPDRPSVAVARGHADATSPRLRRELRGDVDFILLRALRKEPDKRYATVEQFADDIRRHLDGLPVIARTGTWRYHAVKFARRHRASVAAASLVFVTLVAGIIVTAREARIAEAQRRRAESRFNDVRRLANSLIFEVHDSIQDLPGATDARRVILQRSLEYLDSLARESDNEPDLLRELATAYSRIGAVQGNPSAMNLGDAKAAFASIHKSVEMREALARSNPHNHSDQVELAVAYLDYSSYQGRAASVSAAYEYAQRGLAILEREAQSAPNELRIVTLSVRALRILGELQVGEGLSGSIGSASAGLESLQKASRLAARAIELSPSDPLLRVEQARIDIVLGDAFLKLGNRSQALARYQRTLDLLAPIVLRGDSLVAAFDTAVLHGKIGDVALIEGKTSQAVPDYEEALRVVSRLAAAEPLNASIRQQEAVSLVELGHALTELGRADDGVRYARQALARLDASSTSTLVRSTEVLIRGWLGEALERQGKIREASHEYAVSKEVMETVRMGGANDRRVQGFFASATDRLGAALVTLGDVDGGAREYDEAQRVLEPLVKADPDDQELAYALADTYTRQGTLAATRAERARAPEEKLVRWQAARDWFQRSLNTWSTVSHPARMSTSGFEVTLPSEVSNRSTRCEQEIKSLASRVRSAAF